MFKVGQIHKVGDGPWRVTVPVGLMDWGTTYAWTGTMEVMLPEPLSRWYDFEINTKRFEEANRETGIERYYRENPEAP